MAFVPKESSQAEGEPVELYYFTYGTEPDAFHAYTDAEEDVEYLGVTYRAVPIQRENYSSTGSLDKTAMRVRAERENEIAKLFKLYPPSQPVVLTIRQGHLNDLDAEFLVIWSGRILGSERDEDEAIFTVEPTSTSMKRNGLRRNYQLSCPHALYGDQCGANKVLATSDVPILTLTATRLTFAVAWTALDVSKFVGGIVQWDGQFGPEYRTILRTNNVDTLVLNGPTTGLNVGDTVAVSLGCNHQIGDCQALHANAQNFGGQPWIPLENPIRTNPFS